MNESLRTLIVDGDADVAFLAAKALERVGHVVQVCASSADALGQLARTAVPWDALVVGERLVGGSGLALLETLEREGLSRPALFVASDANLAGAALRAGALDVVVQERTLAHLAELPKRLADAVVRGRLLDANRLLLAAVEAAGDAIVVVALDDVVVHCNPAAERLFGVDRDDLLGASVERFEAGESAVRRADGTTLETSRTISPLADRRGKPTHHVRIYRDERERRSIERQLFQAQKMQSVGTLAGGVAHEFNNLLAGVRGYVSLAQTSGKLPTDAAQHLIAASDLIDRAAAVSRQLLSFARRPALAQSPVVAAHLFRTTAELLRRSLGIAVTTSMSEDASDAVVSADANSLQQTLVNLAINARDATPRGGRAEIALTLERVDLATATAAFPEPVPAGAYVVFRIADRGEGMTPEILAQAFDPFFTTKPVGKGTGLGLPVAFGIARAHQGHLTLASVAGHGTTASLFLPRRLAE